MLESCLFILNDKLIPFILALVGFGFLIAIHEFGHFFMCKLFGIHTPTFSLGFGPKIFERKIGTTDFRLSLIPMGGYVEIAGLAEVGQGDQAHAQDRSDTSFENKPYWQKFCVMMGGIVCNMLFAYLTFSGLYYFGIPKEKASVVIQTIEEKSAAHAGYLRKGDIIVGVNGVPFDTQPRKVMQQLNEVLLPQITEHPNGPIILNIKRNEVIHALPITLGSKEVNGKIIGSLGAAFNVSIDVQKGEYDRYPFFEAIKKGIERTNSYVIQIFGFLKSMFSARTLQGAGGPIMILSVSFSMAQKGFLMLLIFLAIISINLAIMNVLPLGVFDGGQLFIVTLEAIFRRKIPENIKIGLALAFWVVLIAMMILLSYRDILAILGR